MAGSATKGMLRDWRLGHTQAERLVAGLLHLEGYRDVDPQHPLGGGRSEGRALHESRPRLGCRSLLLCHTSQLSYVSGPAREHGYYRSGISVGTITGFICRASFSKAPIRSILLLMARS